ncbi:MAG: hypothetical protein GY754_44435 [bacterium]|nr:hypothetical protein [bacterium]
MNTEMLKILQEIYYKGTGGEFTTLYELEIEFGMSGSELRPVLEDLKEGGFIVEFPEGFEITGSGKHFARGRWD